MVFSKTKLRFKYNQFSIKDEDTYKTAFKTKYNIVSIVVSFGLTKTPNTFTTIINNVFNKYMDNFGYVILDDILTW